MIVRYCALAFVIAISASAATHASAFSMGDRPPPNGLNGLSANGFSVSGFTSDVTAVKAVTLRDGTRVVLK